MPAPALFAPPPQVLQSGECDLDELDLSGNMLSRLDAQELLRAAMRPAGDSPSIAVRYLRINEWLEPSTAFHEPSTDLPRPSIRYLRINEWRVPVAELADGLGAHLDFSRQHIGAADAALLAATVLNRPALQPASLKLSGNALGAEGTLAIVRALVEAPFTPLIRFAPFTPLIHAAQSHLSFTHLSFTHLIHLIHRCAPSSSAPSRCERLSSPTSSCAAAASPRCSASSAACPRSRCSTSPPTHSPSRRQRRATRPAATTRWSPPKVTNRREELPFPFTLAHAPSRPHANLLWPLARQARAARSQWRPSHGLL